jgi:hypothetical protein
MNRHTSRLRVFTDHVLGDEPLQNLVAEMRELRDAGISAEEVLCLLGELRLCCPASLTEDRILEIMDYVTGFCSIDQIIWPKINIITTLHL